MGKPGRHRTPGERLGQGSGKRRQQPKVPVLLFTLSFALEGPLSAARMKKDENDTVWIAAPCNPNVAGDGTGNSERARSGHYAWGRGLGMRHLNWAVVADLNHIPVASRLKRWPSSAGPRSRTSRLPIQLRHQTRAPGPERRGPKGRRQRSLNLRTLGPADEGDEIHARTSGGPGGAGEKAEAGDDLAGPHGATSRAFADSIGSVHTGRVRTTAE